MSRFPAWTPRTPCAMDATFPGRYQVVPRLRTRDIVFCDAADDRQLEAAVIAALGTERITFDRSTGLVTSDRRLVAKVSRVGPAAAGACPPAAMESSP